MGFWDFLKTKKEEDFLLLDFGTGAVKGAVFTKGAERNTIKRYGSERIERFGVFDGQEFERDIVKRATGKLYKSLGENPENLQKIISFPPYIVKARAYGVNLRRETPGEKIGEKEKREIHRSVFWEIERRENFQDSQILKRRILRERISGYRVPSILGFKGKDLKIEVLILFAEQDRFQFLETLKKDLNLEDSLIFHQVEGLERFLEFQNKESGIFVDVGHRNTLISVFKEGLRMVEEFQVGGYDFSERISDVLGINKDEAESLKEQFSENRLSPSVRQKLEEIISPVLEKWQRSFREKLHKTGKVYLLGGGSLLPGIKRKIEEAGEFEAQYLFFKDLPVKNKTRVKFSAREIPALLLSFGR